MLTFSVITVTLNPGQSLSDTTGSINDQDPELFEHIIKDGGSKDGSIEAVTTEYPQSIVITKQDRGIYDAMNQAIDSAQGRYLHFLNSGDTYSNRSVLSDIEAFAEANSYPDLIITWYRNRYQSAIRTCPRTISDWFLYRNGLCHQAVYFRKDVFEKHGRYNLDYMLLADHDAIFNALIRNRLSYTVYPKVCVNYDGTGITSKPELQNLKREEARSIRRTYYSGPKRILFFLLHEITLWRLRSYLLQRDRMKWLQSLYYKFVQFVNR